MLPTPPAFPDHLADGYRVMIPASNEPGGSAGLVGHGASITQTKLQHFISDLSLSAQPAVITADIRLAIANVTDAIEYIGNQVRPVPGTAC